MVVDLARNDLSRNGHDVAVEKHKEIQFFSHVNSLSVESERDICMKMQATMQVVADTFPARHIISGAPKHKALQLIEDLRKHQPKFLWWRHWFYGF